MSHNKVKILVVVAILIAVLGLSLFGRQLGIVNDDYSIVYFTTGEVYIGKLAIFPDLQLKDGYILQVTKDPADETKNNFQLNPIKDALWAPQVLHLVKDNLVFYGPLSPESNIAQTLAEQGK